MEIWLVYLKPKLTKSKLCESGGEARARNAIIEGNSDLRQLQFRSLNKTRLRLRHLKSFPLKVPPSSRTPRHWQWDSF
jgi:hypothetical protein